jgi:hypothetical protein
MALSDIQFQQGSGGLGRPLAGQDFYSALVFYSSALPSGFTSNNRILKFLSVNDAIAAGISNNNSDETQATGTYAVTTAGTNGDTILITVTEPYGVIVTLGSYTKTSGATTVTAVGAAIAAAINAQTVNTGYSATAATGTVTITARKGLGIFLNSGTPITVTLSAGATMAGTLTQFSGGVASRNTVYYYHISEFFRIQPQGVLYVGIFAIPGSYTFAEIAQVQSYAQGAVRQWGAYKDGAAFATADLTAIDTQNKTLDTQHAPLIGLYAGDLSGTSDISTLTDLSVLTANTASAIISQDGGATGALLYLTFGKSITTLGAALGAVALANVNEDIGWVQKFNISNGTECETLAFANGELFSDSRVSVNLLTQLDAYRYLFLLKYVGLPGSYFSHFNMAVSISSDYAYGQDNRTIQKAKRGIYAALLPQLNSPLILNADGTLAATTVAYFETLAKAPLTQMVRNSEISDDSVTIDPTQNVLSNGYITINVLLLPDGTARSIIVPIGYTSSLAA